MQTHESYVYVITESGTVLRNIVGISGHWYKSIDYRFQALILVTGQNKIKTFKLDGKRVLPTTLSNQTIVPKNMNIDECRSDYDQEELAIRCGNIVYDLERNGGFDTLENSLNPYTKVTCGGSFTVLETESKKQINLYGYNYYVKEVPTEHDREITHIGCGWDNLYIVFENTLLYVMGRNLGSSLGIPFTNTVRNLTNVPLSLEPNETIVKIAACDYNALILLSSGDVFCNTDRGLFRRVHVDSMRFKDIGCSRFNTIFLNESNQLYFSSCHFKEEEWRHIPLEVPKHVTDTELIVGEHGMVLHFKCTVTGQEFRNKMFTSRRLYNDCTVLTLSEQRQIKKIKLNA
jgi:hypothetical protein